MPRGRPKGSTVPNPRSTVARLRAAHPGDVLWFTEDLRRIDSDARRVGVAVRVQRWIAVRPETLVAERLTRAEILHPSPPA
jgi:hypothetical protein